MRNIIFYEFLNFQLVGIGAIVAFDTAKITYIASATENKQLVQEDLFSF